MLGSKLERMMVFDSKGIEPDTIDAELRPIIEVVRDWREAYRRADVFATCTVPERRYIDEAPAPGTLLLNVSLRDYMPDSVKAVRAIVVDDWDEVSAKTRISSGFISNTG